MCEAVLHSHTGLRVSTNFQRWQFPHQVAFPKKRGFLSSRLSRCPTTRAARPVRHNAGGVFLRLQHASSPSCSTSNRPGSGPGSKVPNYNHAQTRRRRTTRLRVHVVMKVGRRPTKAQRAAFIDSQERPTCGRVLCYLEIFPLWQSELMQVRNLSKFTTSKSDFLSVTPKVTSYYSHTKTSARYVS